VIVTLSRVNSAFSSVKANFTVVAFDMGTSEPARRAVIASVNTFTAAITTEKVARSTETSAFTAENVPISDEKTEITTDKAEVTGEEAEINDEKGEITVEPAEVAREEVQEARNDDGFPDHEEANMSVTTAIKRSIATLKTTGPVPALISSATAIITRMTGNSAFPTPAPPLATVATAIADLQTAETAATARTKPCRGEVGGASRGLTVAATSFGFGQRFGGRCLRTTALST
jgi:hypothetical protein